MNAKTMNTLPHVTLKQAALLGLMSLAFLVQLVTPAAAQRVDRPSREDRQRCHSECRDFRNDCGRACRAEVFDCVRPAKEETRACKASCGETFEAESVELEECNAACVADLLTPVRTECREAGKECRATCNPSDCRRGCRIDADSADPCKAECAHDLRDCAKAGRAELKGCITDAGCRDLEGEEGEACVGVCADAAREGHALCKEAFQGCAESCEAAEDGEEDEADDSAGE